jgi:hypothetical protein
VNRPDLLPQGQVTSVIDVAGFLTPSEEKRIAAEVASLEADTGYKLRVLAQNYPETPGEGRRAPAPRPSPAVIERTRGLLLVKGQGSWRARWTSWTVSG